jgi:hypothetical protein
MGHKVLVLRPRCIRAGRVRTQILFYSILSYRVSFGVFSGVGVDFVFQEYDTGSLNNQIGQNVLQEYHLGYFEPRGQKHKTAPNCQNQITLLHSIISQINGIFS